MCEYFVIRAPADRVLSLAVVGERLSALDLKHDSGGAWVGGHETGGMVVNAEVDDSGRFATAADDLVVSLDVTLWCPHSHRTARWPDEATDQAQHRLMDSMARALEWTVIGQDDPAY